MRIILLLLLSFSLQGAGAQKEGTTLWAFPITSYMVSQNDSMVIVQLDLPTGLVVKNQLAILHGIYRQGATDTVTKGWGRCHLIKANYYYFGLHRQGSIAPIAGDLLYTFIPTPKGPVTLLQKLAANGIVFTSVEDTAFYTVSDYLAGTAGSDEPILESMAADIRRVGDYYVDMGSDMNKAITTGDFKGQQLFTVMRQCSAATVQSFLDYVAHRPRLYAGKHWKVSETFATWLVAGAPQVVKNNL